MSEFTKVPTQFPSKTAYNPKMVLIHLDTLKEVCQELQDTIAVLNERIVSLEGKIVKEKTAKKAE